MSGGGAKAINAYDANNEGTPQWGSCRAAIVLVRTAIKLNMSPYLTLEPNEETDQNWKENADSIARLWRYAPFDQVKFWGPSTSPITTTRIRSSPLAPSASAVLVYHRPASKAIVAARNDGTRSRGPHARRPLAACDPERGVRTGGWRTRAQLVAGQSLRPGRRQQQRGRHAGRHADPATPRP